MEKKKSVLSRRGYTIRKEKYSPRVLHKIRKDLTVAPKTFAQFNQNIVPFQVYMESIRKIYIPRHYGLTELGLPEEQNISSGDEINMKFKGDLRPEQKPVAEKFIDVAVNGNGGGLISLPCGYGKCLGIDTPILLYNGNIEKVQNIRVGDLLMGDDSKPRQVLSISRGRDKMYKIKQDMGEDYICNSVHIISLYYDNGEVSYPIDMEIKDYMNKSNKKYYTGYKRVVDFEFIDTKIDPYLYGKKLLYNNKNYMIIENDYIYNVVIVRKLLLLGLIENIGQMVNGKIVLPLENIPINEWIKIKFLVESLGGNPKKSQDNNYSILNGIDHNYLLTLKPNQLVKIKLEIDELEEDEYYGFEIDGNRRFLLGDFTVTHNTILGIYLACALKRKTLVVVHKDFLVNQWKERIEQFAPEAEIGIIKQNKVNITGKDIVIAMLQSISMKEYPEDTFESFGFVIIDECHHLAAEVFSRALPKIATRYMLGLSATPIRKDGLSKVFEWYLGEMVYCIKQREPDTVLVDLVEYYSDDLRYSKEELMYNGTKCTSRMINNICAFEPRTEIILEKLKTLVEDNRRILILSDRREHLTTMKENLDKMEICSTGYYVGGSKQWELKESEDKDVIFGTYSMACLSDTTKMIDYKTGIEYQLKDLNDMSKKINVISLDTTNNNFEMEQHSRFSYTKSKQCYQIKYFLGELTLSYDHKLYTQRGWIETQNINLEDKLVYSRKIDYPGKYNETYTTDKLDNIAQQLIEKMCVNYIIDGNNSIEPEIMEMGENQIEYLIFSLLDNMKVYPFTILNPVIGNQLIYLMKRIGILVDKIGTQYTIVTRLDDMRNKIIKEYNIPENIKNIYSNFDGNIGYISINEIIKLENSDKIKLCDIEIPKNHSFIIENILVHNSEGMDIPKLNTVILASPKTDVEQSVGRILRQKKKDREKNPLIVDIVDKFSTFVRQSKKRITFYKKQKYTMNTIKIEQLHHNNQPNENQEDLLELFNKGKCVIDDD